MSPETKLTTRSSRQWLLLALTIGLAVAVALSMALAGDAEAKKKKKKKFVFVQQPISQQSTVPQKPGAGFANNLPITDIVTPYTFSDAQKFISLDKITITLTLGDGDTGVGDADRDDLTLVLDDVDTGIKLNDFRNAQTDTPSPISGNLGPGVAAQILNKLKEDNKLAATIKDADPDDNVDGVGVVTVANLVTVPAGNTTLTIEGKQLVQVVKKAKKKKKRH